MKTVAAVPEEEVAKMLHVNRRNGNQIESHRYQIKLSCIVAMRYDDAMNVNLQCTNTPCNKIILAFFSHHTFCSSLSLSLYLTPSTYDSITSYLISLTYSFASLLPRSCHPPSSTIYIAWNLDRFI